MVSFNTLNALELLFMPKVKSRTFVVCQCSSSEKLVPAILRGEVPNFCTTIKTDTMSKIMTVYKQVSPL